MEDTPLGAVVVTESGKTYQAGLAFDSFTRETNLKQHFLGYVLETPASVFDTETPLSRGKSPEGFVQATTPPPRHRFYSSVLLGMLKEKLHPAADVFSRFYGNEEVADTFLFLDMQTSLWQEIRIFLRVPIWPFLKSAIKEMVKSV